MYPQAHSWKIVELELRPPDPPSRSAAVPSIIASLFDSKTSLGLYCHSLVVVCQICVTTSYTIIEVHCASQQFGSQQTH